MKRESVLACYLLDPDDVEGDDPDKAADACVDLAVRVGLGPGVTERNYRAAVMRFIRTKDGWTSDK
ncbi:hypothetical protein DVH05_020224 [Phytophthora capsici]|nr:hypothetical protein DVH05_020224 [Phytophthora capsici]